VYVLVLQAGGSGGSRESPFQFNDISYIKYTVLPQDCDVPLWLSHACLYLIYPIALRRLHLSSEMNSAHLSSFVYTPCIASAEIALVGVVCGEWVWFRYLTPSEILPTLLSYMHMSYMHMNNICHGSAMEVQSLYT
jgi:hypothetical protein